MNITNNNYQELKNYYDSSLNVDKESYQSSNDEPTPIGCIEEMLSKIPNEFWERRHIKILDPCCGNGNFNLVAWNLLKSRGKDWKEVLFFNDINLKRIETTKEIFGFDANITTNNFFEFENKEFYDLIHFNPPYAKMMDNGKRASKNHTLVRDFVAKAMKLLKPLGYMVFIIPDNWMSLADRNEIVKELTSNQLIWINIHGAKKWFPKIGSSFTWVVLQKTDPVLPLTVDCLFKNKQYISTVKSQKRDFIPLLYTNEVQSIIEKTLEADNIKFGIETTSDLHKYTKRNLIVTNKDDDHPYKLIHTPKQTVWASRPHKYQDGYKVFISTTDRYKTFVDNCGMTQSIAFIRCKSKEEADKLNEILNHKLYVFLNNICRWGNFNNIRILQKFPKPHTSDVYKSFNLAQKEIDFIESV